MSNVGKIKIKAFAEMQATTAINVEPEPQANIDNKTPEKKREGRTRAATTTKKGQAKTAPGLIIANTVIKRSNKKTPLPGQMRIDTFFKSAAKNYKVNKEPQSSFKAEDQPLPKRKGSSRGRKRLFDESTTTSAASTDTVDHNPPVKRIQPSRQAKGKENTSLSNLEVIDLCSEEEHVIKEEAETSPTPVASISSPKTVVITKAKLSRGAGVKASEIIGSGVETTSKSSMDSIESPLSKKSTSRKQRKPKPCPPYKIIEGTSFCVDGFQFGDIDGVTHYFLTHYHADHYIGLTKKFCYPLFMSPTTARLVRTFIKIDELYINEIDVDQVVTVDNVEVTALEANHCPGAVMFFFKLNSGECILHTGDFRASAEMESLPIFWNHANIDLLYLDTTYLNKNYDFCHQSESIDQATNLVRAFIEKNPDKRILIVCGSYVIGKEKIWLAVAKEFTMRVWTEKNRSAAIKCLNCPDLQSVLTDDPSEANLHVLSMGKVSYPSLVEYFSLFDERYDMLLGIRPSGWEKNSKPSYGKRISTIGIEYSEHSSYKELERFVRFLKPKRVISTVPVGRDLFVTGKVPTQWYKYEGRASMLSTGYQPSISSFLATPQRVVPKMSSETAMILSPDEELTSNGIRDGVEDDNLKHDFNIVVKNEPLRPDSGRCSETTIINKGLESEIFYDIEIDVKNEVQIAEESQGPERKEVSLSNRSVIVVEKKEQHVNANSSLCKAVVVSRLTSDASDDWLL